MEIQAGKGPWAAPVSGIVPLGSTLTLVVAINDYRGKTPLTYSATVNVMRIENLGISFCKCIKITQGLQGCVTPHSLVGALLCVL